MKNYTTLLTMAKNGEYSKLIEALEENIREEGCKASGIKNRDITIIKNCLKELGNGRSGLYGYHEKDGEFAFLSGYRIFVSGTAFGYDKAEKQFDFVGYRYDGKNQLIGNTVLDRAAIDTFGKLDKAARGKHGRNKPFAVEYTYDGEDLLKGFNAQYLLDAIDFVGNTKMYFADTKYNSPVWFIGENDKADRWAVVLPMHLN